MGQPAARLTDMHTCPMVTGVVPHVGGPISGPGHADGVDWRLARGTSATWRFAPAPPDTLAKGSATVLIGGTPAVRMGDGTAHGEVVVLGCPTVLIGG